MTLELPILRLGLAGFSPQQLEVALAAAESATRPLANWRIVPFTEADAWWLNGARTTVLPDGTLRVAPGAPTARSLVLNPQDIDRPVAFALPMPAEGSVEGATSFALDDLAQCVKVLERFSAWFRPVIAQFSLASAIADHQMSLGSGSFEVIANSRLVAVVNMRGDVGVLPTAGPADFEEAVWRRSAMQEPPIPEHFARATMSQLMWQFAVRTARELLPAHYRTGLLYFRRPPRLQQRLVRDTHLLLLRELAAGCATMEELRHRTGMSYQQLTRDLGALYIVGSITSNPKRAAAGATKRLEANDSLSSAPPSLPPGAAALLVRGPASAADATAPAPLPPN